MVSGTSDVLIQLIRHSGLKSIITIIFLLIIPYTTPSSFNFTSFTPNDPSIIFEGSALTVSSAIQLNKATNIGRATYAQPVRLWNRTSGNITGFSTNFSFAISSSLATSYRDGLAFFLAPYGNKIPTTAATGSLGLQEFTQPSNSSGIYAFVAVEFDIYSNSWDPPGEHVGIDINSMVSVANQTWESAAGSIMGGTPLEARVTYDSTSQNLAVTLYNFSTTNVAISVQSISYVVDLREVLPEFVTVGFSAASSTASAVHSIHSWSFTTFELDAKPTDLPPALHATANSGNSKVGLGIGLAAGGSVTVLGLGYILYHFLKKGEGKKGELDGNSDIFPNDASLKNREGSIEVENSYTLSIDTSSERREGSVHVVSGTSEVVKNVVSETSNVSSNDELLERGSVPRRYTYDELVEATMNFKEMLGSGAFGAVFKGHIKELDRDVAVKKASEEFCRGMQEFKSEVKIISKVRHRNLVELLGWCNEDQKYLLVYEFMPNRSLNHHLFEEECLGWKDRFKIVKGLASALLYLHEECNEDVVHRDIKSDNVLLDACYNAKLSDFGLARLVDPEKGVKTTALRGTQGYVAPEVLTMSGKPSKESDVYSFGVVALEIACGKRATARDEKSGLTLVEWVWGLYGMHKILDAADPRLGTNASDMIEMKILLGVGLCCAHTYSDKRPKIGEVNHMLNSRSVVRPMSYKFPRLSRNLTSVSSQKELYDKESPPSAEESPDTPLIAASK